MEEKIETIIGEFDKYCDTEKYVNILKIHRGFKKLGINKYMYNKTLKNDVIFDELTIIDSPSYDSSYVNYNSVSVWEDKYIKFRNYIRDMHNYTLRDRIYLINDRDDAFKDFINLKMYEGTDDEIIIGQYFPNRNLVTLNLIVKNNLNYENAYIDGYFEMLTNWIKKHDIKTIDNTEFKEELLFIRFNALAENNLRNEEKNLKRYEIESTNLQNSLTNNYIRIKDTRENVETKKKYMKNMKNGLITEIEKIKELKFIKNVRLEEDGIKMETDFVSVNFRGRIVNLGEFIITLCPEEAKIKNKKPVTICGSIYHHPHISNTHVCYGTKGNVIPRLLGNLELKKAVHFLWLYLNGINPGDTYVSVKRWEYAVAHDYKFNDEDEEDDDEDNDEYEEEDWGDDQDD